MKLFKHQQESVKFFNTTPIVFDMSDAGTGKTGAHITWFFKRRTRKAMLVLAPKSLLVSAWANDIKKFAPMLKVSVATAANRRKAFAAEFDVLITNHDAVKELLKMPVKWFKLFDTVVIDECFPAGTPVDTPNGPVPIEMLKTGDLINTSSGPLPISNTFQHQTML
jgi:superfamily II DNA or RNA helicase